MLRILVIAVVVSGVFSAVLTFWEGHTMLNRIHASIETSVAQLPDAAEATAALRDSYANIKHHVWIKEYWIGRFPWVWLCTFASCVIVSFLAVRGRRAVELAKSRE